MKKTYFKNAFPEGRFVFFAGPDGQQESLPPPEQPEDENRDAPRSPEDVAKDAKAKAGENIGKFDPVPLETESPKMPQRPEWAEKNSELYSKVFAVYLKAEKYIKDQIKDGNTDIETTENIAAVMRDYMLDFYNNLSRDEQQVLLHVEQPFFQWPIGLGKGSSHWKAHKRYYSPAHWYNISFRLEENDENFILKATCDKIS